MKNLLSGVVAFTLVWGNFAQSSFDRLGHYVRSIYSIVWGS